MYLFTLEGRQTRISNSLFRALKQMEVKCIKKDDLPTPIRILIQAKAIAISLLRSASSFLSTQSIRPKSTKWSSVLIAWSKREALTEENGEGRGAERLGILTWRESHACKDAADSERVAKAQTQVQMLKVTFDELESGLDCLFRQLILARVSLLHSLSSCTL